MLVWYCPWSLVQEPTPPTTWPFMVDTIEVVYPWRVPVTGYMQALGEPITNVTAMARTVKYLGGRPTVRASHLAPTVYGVTT